MQLREKLRLAPAAAPVRSASTQPPLAAAVLRHDLSLPVERQETEAGDVWVAEERWPLGFRHGHLALGHALEVGEAALARLAPGLEPADLERAAFVDVETTGLAGGTGTLAFMVGVATFENPGLCLRQFFLADLGGEGARRGGGAGAGAPGDPHACLALARWDEAQGRLAQAAALYRSALDASIGGEGQGFGLPRRGGVH